MTKTRFGFFNTFLSERNICEIMSDDERQFDEQAFNQQSDDEQAFNEQHKRLLGDVVSDDEDPNKRVSKHQVVEKLIDHHQIGSFDKPIIVSDEQESNQQFNIRASDEQAFNEQAFNKQHKRLPSDEDDENQNPCDLKRPTMDYLQDLGSPQNPIWVLDDEGPTDPDPLADPLGLERMEIDVEQPIEEPPVVEQPVEEPVVEQPVEEKQQPPPVVVLGGNTHNDIRLLRQFLSNLTLLGVERLVVILDHENQDRILGFLIRELEKLGNGPKSHKRLSELMIFSNVQLWNVQSRIKRILEMFTQLPRACSLLVGGDLLAGQLAGQYESSFPFGKLSCLSIALGVWPGLPTDRANRTEFQKLFHACGLTPERVQQSFLRQVSFVRMKSVFQNEQFLDLSKPLLQDLSGFTSAIVQPMDTIEYAERQIFPHVNVYEETCDWRAIIPAHQDKYQLCDTLAHMLRVNKTHYKIWMKSRLLCIWMLQGQRTWNNEANEWSESKSTLRFPFPRDVIQLILCQLSLHDYKTPAKTSVCIQHTHRIITETSEHPLVVEWLRSCDEEDKLKNAEQKWQRQLEEAQCQLLIIAQSKIRAAQKTDQNEANAAEVLDQNGRHLSSEVKIHTGEASRPRKTQEEKEAAKAAKAAKAAAKAAAQTNGKKRKKE